MISIKFLFMSKYWRISRCSRGSLLFANLDIDILGKFVVPTLEVAFDPSKQEYPVK